MFPLAYQPGEIGFCDFTKVKRVEITLRGEPFPHLLFHYRLALSADNEVGRSATSSLAGGVSAGDPGADAQGPGDAGTTDEPPTQPVHGETTRWQQPGGCCRSGRHLSAQCPPD
jgi:hypothetical protein